MLPQPASNRNVAQSANNRNGRPPFRLLTGCGNIYFDCWQSSNRNGSKLAGLLPHELHKELLTTHCAKPPSPHLG